MIVVCRNDVARPHRIQFSLRLLLIVTALAGVGFAGYRKSVAITRPDRFLAAVRVGDLEEVDRLLKEDPELAHRRFGDEDKHHVALHVAFVFSPNPKVIERILQEKPNVNARMSEDLTALHLAVCGQEASKVAWLLQLGADPNIVDDRGETALHFATTGDPQAKITRMLLAAGADPNRATRIDDGRTPLHLAAGSGHTLVAEALIDAGAVLNCRDEQGKTPLYLAMERIDLAMCQLLLQRAIAPMAKDLTQFLETLRTSTGNEK